MGAKQDNIIISFWATLFLVFAAIVFVFGILFIIEKPFVGLIVAAFFVVWFCLYQVQKRM